MINPTHCPNTYCLIHLLVYLYILPIESFFVGPHPWKGRKSVVGEVPFFPGFTHRMVKYSCFFSFSNGRILIPWWSWPKMFGIWNVHTLTWGIIQTLINFDDYCFQRVVQPPTRIWFQHQQKTLQTPILLDVRDAVHGNDLKPLKSSAGKRYPANLQSATKNHAQCLAQLIFKHLFFFICFFGKGHDLELQSKIPFTDLFRFVWHTGTPFTWLSGLHHEPLQSCQRRGQKWFRWKVFSHVAGWWWKGQTQWVCWNQEHVSRFFAGIVFVWLLCGAGTLVSLYFLPFPKSNLDLIAKYINMQQRNQQPFVNDGSGFLCWFLLLLVVPALSTQ